MQRTEVDKQIAFNVDGLYIRLRGPFPKAVIEAADNITQFAGRGALVAWLNHEWPEWRNSIVASENLW